MRTTSISIPCVLLLGSILLVVPPAPAAGPAASVRAWGANWWGEIGDGSQEHRSEPVVTLGAHSILAIDAGLYGHSLALRSDGVVLAWGQGEWGQLGNGSFASDSRTPSPVNGLADVIAISAGSQYSLAVRADGTVWAWGRNTHGAFGDGTTVSRAAPVQVEGLSDVIDVAAGGYFAFPSYAHSLALRADGTVWSWGANESGQLGDGTNVERFTPVQVIGLGAAVAIAAGGFHSLALRSDGTAWAWGRNLSGELGDGTLLNRRTPKRLAGLASVVAVSAGFHHSLATLSDGSTWAWGHNEVGQLGDGTTTRRTSPVLVTGLPIGSRVDAGGWHSLALDPRGAVWGWGENSTGQVGDGTRIVRTTPTLVRGAIGATQITAGGYHSLAASCVPSTEPGAFAATPGCVLG